MWEASQSGEGAADVRIPVFTTQRPDASERTPGTDIWSSGLPHT